MNLLAAWPAGWTRQKKSTATILAASAALLLILWLIALPLSLLPEPVGPAARELAAGTRVTVELTVVAGLAGVALGVVAAVAKVSPVAPVRWLADLYVWVVRGTPLLVQVLFVFLALPLIIPGLKLSDFNSAVVALSVNVGAYNAEALRAGIQAVPKGQTEASRSLGLSPLQTFTHIVFPQSFKIALPPLVNNIVALLKDSSLAYVIGVVELSNVGSRVQAATFQPVPVFLATASIYLVLTTVLTQNLRGHRGAARRRAAPLVTVHAMTPAQAAQLPPLPRPPSSHMSLVHPVSEKPDARAALVSTEGVNKHFGAAHVLVDVTTRFYEGEVAVIVGASGSGKSTFLRTLNRLEKHESGRIVVDGITLDDDVKNLDAIRREVGMVFQQFNLFPHLTALDNVALAPRLVRRTARGEAKRSALEILTRVGLAEHVHKHPFQLSGGQQQRVAIARSLAMNPRVLLFDEPTSALDPEMINEVLDVMKDLARAGMTMIVVTHEMRFAREVGDRILFFDQGRLLQDSPPDAFFDDQRNDRIRSFLGQLTH